MKKFNISLFTVAATALMFAGCSNDIETPTPNTETEQSGTGFIRLSASTPETPDADASTKAGWTETGTKRAIWHADDEIGVSIYSTVNDGGQDHRSLLTGTTPLCFRQNGTLRDNETKTDFIGQVESTINGDGDYMFLSYYPHNAGSGFVDDTAPYFNIPVSSSQEYVAGGFKGIPMVSYFKGKASTPMAFNAIYSVIKLNVSGNKTIKWVKVRGNNNEVMSGKLKVVPSTAEVTLPTTGSDCVTLSFGDAGKSFSSAANIYIYLPAQTYSQGFTIEFFESSETGSYVFTANSSFNLAAGKIHSLGNIKLSSKLAAINIPDAAFRSYLADMEYITTSGNTVTGITEAGLTTNIIDVANNDQILSLQGIEYFPGITELWCGYTGIKSLDVSSNTALEVLNCSGTAITALDLSKNTVLTTLNCSNTNIDALDLSKCPSLKVLNCSKAKISILDLSRNPILNNLNCSDNNISALDISVCPELTYLDCGNNFEITSIDISKNAKLKSFTSYGLSANGITLDFSSNTDLTFINCANMKYLRSLDVSMLTKLETLLCHSCQLTSVDVSGLTALTALECYDASPTNNVYYLKKLNISGAKKLQDLSFTKKGYNIENNKLTLFDQPDASKLEELIADGDFNFFTKVECQNHPTLTNISLKNSTTLTSVTVKNNTQQITLDMSGSNPTTKDTDSKVTIVQ